MVGLPAFGYNSLDMPAIRPVSEVKRMTVVRESQAIQGVYIVELKAFEDERGRFSETFRKEWFPQRDWRRLQCNRSESHAGVLRGLHYHFHQVDYWCVMQGEIRAALADIRPDSPTFRATQIVPMDGDAQVGLFIPVGVAHGFAALRPTVLTYVVDNYYDSNDEYGVAWNDPTLALDWGITALRLSARDQANPRLDEIPPDRLPDMAQSGKRGVGDQGSGIGDRGSGTGRA
jgi:dTDP-4-dehydrorhamnose 3,5-epimerase